MESIGKSIKNLVPDDIDSLDGKEKTDATPENMKKIDDVILSNRNSSGSMSDKKTTSNYANEHSNVETINRIHKADSEKTGVENELKIIEVEDESPTSTKYEYSSLNSSQQSFAFTIDFGNTSGSNIDGGGGGGSGSSSSNNTKYKTMLERFQNRHRRGSSMSTLYTDNIENNPNLSSPTSTNTNTPRVMSAQSTRQGRKNTNNTDTEAGKVKLRLRERSTSGVRDSSKRHSWSPRSSTVEPNFSMDHHHQKQAITNKVKASPLSSQHTSNNNQSVKSNYLDNSKLKNSSSSTNRSSDLNESITTTPRTEFAPRSTAMQMALDKIDFLCPQPPLDNYRIDTQKGGHIDGDDISEAGTYTLDGDNYTEEQKDLMNIDKGNLSVDEIIDARPQLSKNLSQRPTELSIHSISPRSQENQRINTLDIGYYHHDSSSSKPKISYLDKIKSRVKNFTKSPDKIEKSKHSLSNDKGSVTSITTSGILAKKLTLDPHPKLNRKNSLTTSQIDSTEYIGNDMMKSSTVNSSAYSSGAFTDHQKAEYRLFTKQTDSDNLSETEPPFTPDSPQHENSTANFSDTAGLKTAQTKSDWIQEWARNARARSVSAATNPEQVTKQRNNIMSRSYNCEAAEENSAAIFGEGLGNLIYRNKQIDKLKPNSPSSYEYSSDPNVSKNYMSDLVLSARPPLSPSKIPSPIPSFSRARSNSKVRASLQDLSPAGQVSDTDIYLQKTQAAITNLSQTLSLNSVNSPRRGFYGQRNSTDLLYTNQDVRPHGMHKRNLSLDYRLQNHNSTTKFTLPNSLTNDLNDCRSQQSRVNNTIDTNNVQKQHLKSPKTQTIRYIDQTSQSIKQPTQLSSPLRRSSSFSAKTLTAGGAYRATGANANRINSVFAQKSINQQTPTNLRYNASSQSTPKYSLQKSASSNSFRKMYSDYDDNVAYYINDEDDLDYISPEDVDESTGINYGHIEQQQEVPLSNTRYNKALLMRIEKSKQKVNGNSGVVTTKPAPGGSVACTNTPELPRRTIQTGQRASMRQSVPRDSSLNRLKVDGPNSLASAKKELLQPTNDRKATPRYLDISKYKPTQGATFLKKDETKVTLKSEIKRSPSSASVSLNRTDPSRSSSRSMKSNKPGGRPLSATAKRDQSATKQKEAELAMWRRRATYDPMKAAAEDKRKKDEAKKQVKSTESSSVLRSQSFNCGVGEITANNKFNYRRNSQNHPDEANHCWALISSEDDDDDDDDGLYLSSSTNTTN